MKRNLYGKKMFVADLLIVSVWALFAWHSCWSGFAMPAFVLMRVSLSFELYRRSRWTSLSALMFAFAYIACVFSMPSSEYVIDPIEKIMYVGLCLVGESDLAIVSLGSLDAVIPRWILGTIWGIISGWLVLIPLVCSIKLKNCIGILLSKRRLWWYLISILAVTILLCVEVQDYSIIVFCSLMSLLPLTYWIFYSGRKRQLIQYVMQDKVLAGYVAILAVFVLAMLIGLYNIVPAKTLAAFLFPIILYVITIRLIDFRPDTVSAMMFGLGGLFFINCANRTHELVIAWLFAGVVLTLGVTVRFILKSQRFWIPIMLFIANGFILPVILLGYNPYVAINANYVDLMKSDYYRAPNGLYEFSEYGLFGVRDRYGVIIPAEYYNLDFLEYTSDYMVLTTGEPNSPNYHLQIFDLRGRDYLIPEDGHKVTRIEKIDYKKYALFDKSGEQVYTLRLVPGNHYSSDYGTYYGYRLDSPYLVDCKSHYLNETITSFPHDLKEAERKLLEIYNTKGYCGPYLMDLLMQNGETIKYQFNQLQKSTGIRITTSIDNKVRLYSWDTGLGGTSPEYQSLVQYVSGDTVLAKYFYPIYDSKYVCSDDIRKDGHEIFEGSFCDGLHQITMGNEQNAYAVAYNRASSVEGAQECVLMYEKDGRLEKLPFVNKFGEEQYSVGVMYSIPDWYFTTDGLGWDWVMSFDDSRQTLYVPEVGDMEMSDRYELYRHDNGRMVHIGNGAGYWLHPSLHDFKRLCGIYRTDTKFIRIDLLKDNSYRFASWSKDKAMSGEPELVLHNGKTGIVENAIVFQNGDYTYIVPEYRRGHGNDFGKMIIKHKDKVIQESKV